MQPGFEDAKLLWQMFYAGQCFKDGEAAGHLVQEKVEDPC